MVTMDGIILSLSLVLSSIFIVYASNCYLLLLLSRRYSQPRALNDKRPGVALHLPIYNERYVLPRLIGACSAMADAYGRDRVRIMVLDDSEDETSDIARRLASEYALRGYRIEVLHRGDRGGFKAGAMQRALEKTDEDFIAVFDSDFMPPRDFLLKTLPIIEEDPGVGIVQCRWGHVDRGYNVITKSVAIGIDGHFFVEQAGRFVGGFYLNFNGSGGVIRKRALLEAGGWDADTLAEDLDMSYRLQMKGYRVLFLRDTVAPAEVTPTITSFKRQQRRWACGSLQTAKKLLPSIMRARNLSFLQKFQALLHLTYYMVHPLMLFSFILASIAALSGFGNAPLPEALRLEWEGGGILHVLPAAAKWTVVLLTTYPLWVTFGIAMIMSTFAAWVYYGATVKSQGAGLLRNLPYLIFLGIIGYGLSASNSVEAFKALLSKRRWRFERTPKYAIVGKGDEWRDKKYQVPLDRVVFFELSLFSVGLLSILRALETGAWGLIPTLAVFTLSYLTVCLCTFAHS